MRLMATCCAALLALQLSNAANAAPMGYYNPTTGAIFLSNDTGGSLDHITIVSASGQLRPDPALYAAFPGAVFDQGDLPGAFTYLYYPQVGLFSPASFIGNVIVPGTPQSDLSGYYRRSFLDPPELVRFIESEPASSALGVAAAFIFSVCSRRFRPS